MVDPEESLLPGKLFRGANLRYLIEDGNVWASSEDGVDVVVRTRNNQDLIVGGEAVQLTPAMFPLVLSGEKIRLRNILKTGAVTVEENIALEGFDLGQYTLQLKPDIQDPEGVERVKITQSLGIEELITINPAMQTVSGFGIFLVVAISIACCCCCWKSPAFRTCLKMTFCAACNYRELMDRIGQRWEEHGESYQAFKETRRRHKEARSRRARQERPMVMARLAAETDNSDGEGGLLSIPRRGPSAPPAEDIPLHSWQKDEEPISI